MLGRRRSDVVGGAREAAVVEVVVRAADRRRGEDGLCGNQPASCGAPEIDFHTAADRELRDAPVVVRVPVVVAEMFVIVGPTMAHQKKTCFSRRTTLRLRMESLDGLKMPCG